MEDLIADLGVSGCIGVAKQRNFQLTATAWSQYVLFVIAMHVAYLTVSDEF